MDERALKSWVSDKLHDILGFAEGGSVSRFSSGGALRGGARL